LELLAGRLTCQFMSFGGRQMVKTTQEGLEGCRELLRNIRALRV